MRLSIIIPVYQVEAYIGETLSSVFATSASDDSYEVIVVNDGTKDRSMEVVHQFSDWPNLIVMEEQNRGLSTARMNGLSVAHGEYVWFVDSDDYLVKDGVGMVMRLLAERPEVDVLMFPLLWTYEDESMNRLDYVLDGEKTVLGKSVIKDLGLPVWASQRFVFKRSLAENPWVFFPAGLIHEDEYFGPVLVYLSFRVCVIKDPVYFYRIRPGSTITSHLDRSPYDMVSVCKCLFRFLDRVVDQDDKDWFRGYSVNRLLVPYADASLRGFTPQFCRFARSRGFYVWRQWLKVHPATTLKNKYGRLLFYLYPGFRQFFLRRVFGSQ